MEDPGGQVRHGTIVAVFVVLIVGAFVLTVTAAAYPLISASLWPDPPDLNPSLPEWDPPTDSDLLEEPEEPDQGKPPFAHPQPVNVPGFPSEDFPTCRFCM